MIRKVQTKRKELYGKKNNLKRAKKRWKEQGMRRERRVIEKREKTRGGGDGLKNETKREEIALKAVDLSELNHRRPAVRSDSTSPLNITDAGMDRYRTRQQTHR